MRQLSKILLIITIIVVIAGAGMFAYSSYAGSKRAAQSLVFSNYAMRNELWNTYKKSNLEPSSHRTLDKQQGNITTSEGESYTMLRAVWSDDRTTFEQSRLWARNNMQRPDYLYSWKFGNEGNGKYGILTSLGGNNTASDADEDIALAELMAYSRWNDSSYDFLAKQVINAIWNEEVVMVAGKPVLVADNLESAANNTVVRVNPSYLAPYEYKLFAKADPNKSHDWNALADNSYSILEQASKANLDKGSSDGLPPDWIQINKATGKITAASGQDSNYSYDAIRTPFRLALDYAWFKDPRDKQVLSGFSFLQKQWDQTGGIKASYAHDGTPLVNYESISTYGASIGYFYVESPSTAKDIYTNKLASLYDPDTQSWKGTLSYYDDNWAWFGIALTQGALPQLAH